MSRATLRLVVDGRAMVDEDVTGQRGRGVHTTLPAGGPETGSDDAGRRLRLRLVKGVHTLVWLAFVACIVGIPLASLDGRHGLAGVLALVVLGEVLVLGANGWVCPLTPIAARYTEERQDNFDIYLPLWLARHNKEIFGTLYLLGAAFALVRWWWGG